MKTSTYIAALAFAGTLVAGVASVGQAHVADVSLQPREAEQSAADDGAIKAKVEAVLNRHPAVARSGIRVASVNNGVVLLNGNATSIEAHLLAVELAGQVPEVRSVATQVVVSDGPSMPTSAPDASNDVGLTGCIREVGSRYVLKELAATGHALPESRRPRTLILKSAEAGRVRLNQHVGNIVAVTGSVEATPTFNETPTLVVSSLRHVSDTCQG